MRTCRTIKKSKIERQIKFFLATSMFLALYSYYVEADAAPNVIFYSQSPADLNSLNAVNTGFNITYNITDADLNVSTIVLFYKTNRTNQDYSRYVNGTATAGFTTEENYSYASGDLYKWVLDDNEIYPATYNLDPELMEEPGHLDYSLYRQNEYLKINLLNVSASTYYNFFEIMARNVTVATALRVYYCNSSYSSETVITSANCYNFGNILPGVPYDHCHSEHVGNYSCHHVLPFPVNSTSGKIGAVSVTSSSYFILRNAQTGIWNISYVKNVSRANAIQQSLNSGNAWTNRAFTVDSHLHQYDGTDTLYYYVCANDTSGNQSCSSVRYDPIELGSLPPSSPFVYSPSNSTYRNSISINYTAAVSPNNYPILFYNISLLNADFSFNKTIVSNNSVNLSYIWDISSQAYGAYSIRVEACDSLNQCSSGFSELFNIENANLTIYDSAEGLTLDCNASITVYANYTNITSGAMITGATCNVTFAGDAIVYGLSWDGDNYYNDSKNFSTSGNKAYNISCSHPSFTPLTASDSVNIIGPTCITAPVPSQLVCKVVNGACSIGELKVMGLSNYTNAHVENATINSADYNYSVCCYDNLSIYILNTDCGTELLALNETTNSHVEKPFMNSPDYPYSICMDADFTSINCTFTSSSCPVSKTCVVTLNETLPDYPNTSMHVASCDNQPYTEKLCCGFNNQCGDGTCDPGETAVFCPKDCPGTCGDGTCNPYFDETPFTCPEDCTEEGAIPEFSPSGLLFSLIIIIIGTLLIKRKYERELLEQKGKNQKRNKRK